MKKIIIKLNLSDIIGVFVLKTIVVKLCCKVFATYKQFGNFTVE